MKLSEQLQQVMAQVHGKLVQANVQKVSKACGISASNVYRLRNGGTPTLSTLELLAVYFESQDGSQS
ncbi:helix-turn-helix domain-containing protein [Blastopirellula marina]|uniref:HTH cro/C1-type domain-containing protein n=1 Tax=Blastopirellula marina DSM 3645 TaxID=314230 RepID=A3ZPR1_9BACT|nr:helix-turn-helix transcriptional regulator [Blastopirellula marina]EAQ81739.1 hypothetical protein DSM3645_29197 [Blastopirellula marina DSM 3645]